MKKSMDLSYAFAVLLGATLTVIMTLGLQAIADQNPTTDNVVRQINYNGILESNGQPINAADGLWMRFVIYDGPVLDTEVYQQDINVAVYQGRFSTTIGPIANNGSALEEVIRAADDLYVSITLLNDPDNDDDDIPLSNAQRLSITPYAVWARHATDFNVANQLIVGQNIAAGQDVTVGRDMDVSRDIDVGGNVVVDGDLDVRGTIRGTLSIVTVARNDLHNEVRTFIACPENTNPISCSLRKFNETAIDVGLCELDFGRSGCEVLFDIAGSPSPNRASCHCLRMPE